MRVTAAYHNQYAYGRLLEASGHVRSTYGLKQAGVVRELRAIMFSRIIKFRRGDQYEEMQGRDVAGKTTDAVSPTPNINRAVETNLQPDGTSDSHQDTTPEGTFFQIVFSA